MGSLPGRGGVQLCLVRPAARLGFGRVADAARDNARMHYVIDGALFVGFVLRDALVRVISDRINPALAKLPRSLTVRGWWRRAEPVVEVIEMPTAYRDLPGGLGYRVPARFADPFTGDPFPTA
jgi:hypothetical protein